GNGSPQHLAAEQLKRMAGIDLVHVPYKGAAPTAAALLAGEVSIAFNIILLPLPHVHAGKLPGLAVASAKRSPLAPDIPTLAELGYPIDIDTWYGLVAPAAPRPRDAHGVSRAADAVGRRATPQDDGRVRRPAAGALARQPADRDAGTARQDARARAHRERRARRAVPQASRPFSGVHRLDADEQRGGLSARGRPR